MAETQMANPAADTPKASQKTAISLADINFGNNPVRRWDAVGEAMNALLDGRLSVRQGEKSAGILELINKPLRQWMEDNKTKLGDKYVEVPLSETFDPEKTTRAISVYQQVNAKGGKPLGTKLGELDRETFEHMQLNRLLAKMGEELADKAYRHDSKFPKRSTDWVAKNTTSAGDGAAAPRAEGQTHAPRRSAPSTPATPPHGAPTPTPPASAPVPAPAPAPAPKVGTDLQQIRTARKTAEDVSSTVKTSAGAAATQEQNTRQAATDITTSTKEDEIKDRAAKIRDAQKKVEAEDTKAKAEQQKADKAKKDAEDALARIEKAGKASKQQVDEAKRLVAEIGTLHAGTQAEVSKVATFLSQMNSRLSAAETAIKDQRWLKNGASYPQIKPILGSLDKLGRRLKGETSSDPALQADAKKAREEVKLVEHGLDRILEVKSPNGYVIKSVRGDKIAGAIKFPDKRELPFIADLKVDPKTNEIQEKTINIGGVKSNYTTLLDKTLAKGVVDALAQSPGHKLVDVVATKDGAKAWIFTRLKDATDYSGITVWQLTKDAMARTPMTLKSKPTMTGGVTEFDTESGKFALPSNKRVPIKLNGDALVPKLTD